MAGPGLPEARVIGVDVGGTKTLAAVVGRDGRIERRHERRTPVASKEELLAGLEDAVCELFDSGIAALGVGIPSIIDRRTHTAVFSTNIPLAGVDVSGRLAERFGLAVEIDNDANAAAIAEWRLGAGRGARTMAMLTLGTGIGGGLILDGRPFRGAVGGAAELGHIVVEHDGPRCQGACGGRGHLEALASGRAADAAARRLFGSDADARVLVARAREGDARARDVLEEMGRRLGSGIATLVNALDPELVVVGGGFAAAGDLLLAPARAVLRREALPPARDVVRVVPAELGPEAGVIGAGLIALERLDAGAPVA